MDHELHGTNLQVDFEDQEISTQRTLIRRERKEKPLSFDAHSAKQYRTLPYELRSLISVFSLNYFSLRTLHLMNRCTVRSVLL